MTGWRPFGEPVASLDLLRLEDSALRECSEMTPYGYRERL